MNCIQLISISITRNKLTLCRIYNNNILIALFSYLLNDNVFLLRLRESRDALEILNSILLIELLSFFHEKISVYF